MSLSTYYPQLKPSLNLDFASTKQLDPRITFTRASTATFYDGLTVAKAEENLLTFSQGFDNTAWENPSSNVSITANTTTAPDGTTTADTIAQTAVNNYFLIQQNKTITANTTYVFSAHVKNVDINYVTIELYGANSNFAYAEFDLTTGVLSRSSATGTGWSLGSTAIQAVGASGWYRIFAVITAGTTVSSPRQRIFLTDGTTAISATTGLSVFAGTSLSAYLWGAQLEQRSAVTAYTATTTQPITNYIPALRTAAAGVARFNHNPVTGESLGLLIEEQRANLLTYSEQFDNAAWTKNDSTITANTIIAPDGTLTGDKLNSNSGVLGSLTRSATTANSVITIYVKFAGSQYCLLGTAAAKVVVDLISGTLSKTSDAFNTYSITNAGNGWYRVSIANITATSYQIQIESSSTSTGISLNGNGWDGIFIWGAQLEAGAFPTSYIPTVASSVTRSADAANMTGTNFSSWYRGDEGTFFAEANTENTSSVRWILAASASSTTNADQIDLRVNTGGTARSAIIYNSVQQAQLTSATSFYADRAYAKQAMAFKFNDVAMSANASAVLTDTSCNVPAVSFFYIGSQLNGGTPLNGTIKRIAYYPTRLTNAQLQSLTT